MKVRFERTGKHRYAVAVLRDEHGATVILDWVAGYSDLIPHDLVHWVVGAMFGLRDGIFGLLAAGGTLGAAFPTAELRTRPWARQVERRNRLTGSHIGRSEALAGQVYPLGYGTAAPPGSHYVRAGPSSAELSGVELKRAIKRLTPCPADGVPSASEGR